MNRSATLAVIQLDRESVEPEPIYASLRQRRNSQIVIFRAESRRTHSGDDSQKLLKSHLKIKKPTLAKDPTVIVENLIRDHQGQTGECRYRRKSSWFFDLPDAADSILWLPAVSRKYVGLP